MKVLREFTPQQRSLFLKFVTSCPRPPLLGFSELQVQPSCSQCCAASNLTHTDPPPLQPPLCIYLIPSERGFFSFGDEERLPSASTCFNLLKLPPYKSSKVSRIPSSSPCHLALALAPPPPCNPMIRCEQVLREKLLYAITSGAGFELS
jgi:hypothetical protein